MKSYRLQTSILLPHRSYIQTIFLLASLFLTSCIQSVSAQSTRLQPLKAYEETLKRYHNRKWTVNRKEFQVVNKKKWWYYLPNVGWAFGMPTVTLGTSTLAQIDRDKAVNTAKLEGLDARARLEYNEQLEELSTRYRILVVEIDALKDQKVLNVLESRILQISEKADLAKEIRPEVHLAELLKFQRNRLADEAERRRLAIAVVELERFAHFNLTEDELAYFDEDEHDGLTQQKVKE